MFTCADCGEQKEGEPFVSGHFCGRRPSDSVHGPICESCAEDMGELADIIREFKANPKHVNDINTYLDVRDMTQNELADRAGISPQYLSDILNEKRLLSVEAALRLGEAMGELDPGAEPNHEAPMVWLRLQLKDKYVAKKSEILEDLA